MVGSCGYGHCGVEGSLGLFGRPLLNLLLLLMWLWSWVWDCVELWLCEKNLLGSSVALNLLHGWFWPSSFLSVFSVSLLFLAVVLPGFSLLLGFVRLLSVRFFRG